MSPKENYHPPNTPTQQALSHIKEAETCLRALVQSKEVLHLTIEQLIAQDSDTYLTIGALLFLRNAREELE